MSNIAYKLKRDPTDEDKIAKTPQVKVVLKHLQTVGVGHTIERDALAQKVDADPEFVSRQGAGKILNFYIPKLVSVGLVEKISTAPVVEKTEGDAKADGKSKPKAAGKSKAKPEPAEATVGEEEEALAASD